MTVIGIIGGTGALELAAAAPALDRPVHTPYGDNSSPILRWETGRAGFRFIARHGLDSSIPPHRVNYRANVWALHEEGVDYVIGVNAVGGIAPHTAPGRLIVPDQLVDYTWGRAHTFADGELQPLQHIEFTEPFSEEVRRMLLDTAARIDLDYHAGGTYGAIQGPRLETAAEIERMARDGCDIVGMTGMPEAALAREVGLEYAICGVVVNWAAGRAPGDVGIHAEIQSNIVAGMAQVGRLLAGL